MKIQFLMRKLSSCPRRRRGLTILEMLVSTAMLSFIVLGLTAMLIQTQKAFKSGIKQNTITDSARTVIDMITGDLRQMSDGQNIYVTNFYWGARFLTNVVNYENGVAIRTNELNDIYILEHTNTVWLGVGYAVSNYHGTSVGALYRYETNWTALAPILTNDLYYPFYTNFLITGAPPFSSLYWHKVADGVIDLKIRAFDQFGNENDLNEGANEYKTFSFSYPILANPPYPATNTLPNSVELEFGMLEPDALVQVRGLAGNAGALANFLSTNAAPKTEVFRQRITIASAIR
jgi:hypothetical protein